MDRRSWLWKKKSSDKSPGGETESSGSMSSHSERYSDDQEGLKASPNDNAQSPEVTSKAEVTSEEVNDNLKSLREKLSAALINISAKEDLVKQHSKVAEEAVSGWEMAENESASLKLQLEAAAQKNLALEDRLGHLDGALKECLRKLRQAREEQEQKIHEAVVKNTREFESSKLELEKQLVELQVQLEAAKISEANNTYSDLFLQLESAEKQNSSLKRELLARAEELEMMTLERDLSTETAEIASKQHLESIKKVAKLEAECRKLKAMARKTSSFNDHKSVTASSAYIESLTDSQSDSGERFLALELNGGEPSCSDSWASALITELDQFKNPKPINKNLTSMSIEIDLMDDFLEMERLASLPPTRNTKREIEPGVEAAMLERMGELETKLEKVEAEKAALEEALAESQEQLKTSQNQLKECEDEIMELHKQLDITENSKQAAEGEVKEYKDKIMELHKQLDITKNSNQAAEGEMKAEIAKREVVESKLIAMDAEVLTLRSKVGSLEKEVEEERVSSAEIMTRCQKLEDELSRKRQEAKQRQSAISNGESKIKQEKELEVAAGKLAECQKTIASLGRQLKSLATLEDFMIDSEQPAESNGGSPEIPKINGSPSTSGFVSRTNTDPLRTPRIDGKNSISPQSSSSSSSTSNSSVNISVTSDKNRNGFGKLFSRSKSAMKGETR
ncbi:hypothetical protein ACHQM5_022817 [Ranunculus cassubicifolius]